MRLYIKTAILLSFLFSCCQKENNSESGLSSRWQWVMSSGGIAGIGYTPESTGDNIMIEFTPDSIYKKYLNGSLTTECGFHIIESTSIFTHDTTNIIVYDSISIWQSWEIIDNNLLILNDEVYDGFEHKYKRIR